MITKHIAIVAGLVASTVLAGAAPLRVLLLTGANNHDWRVTTPVLKTILEDSGRFVVEVETNVAGMKPEVFSRYDVLLSNFNTFGQPQAGEVWNPEMRAAFVKFIHDGHGFVVVHAGSSVFYDWLEFQKLAGATWGKDTSHGRMHTNEIHFTAVSHPVTAGLKDFPTFDEFWQNSVIASNATALATVTPRKESGGTGKPEPIALVTESGKGRGFTLLLGHDVKAMESDGFKTLLRRGTEWAATGKVSAEGIKP